jgi:hypothetical protein
MLLPMFDRRASLNQRGGNCDRPTHSMPPPPATASSSACWIAFDPVVGSGATAGVGQAVSRTYGEFLQVAAKASR